MYVCMYVCMCVCACVRACVCVFKKATTATFVQNSLYRDSILSFVWMGSKGINRRKQIRTWDKIRQFGLTGY